MKSAKECIKTRDLDTAYTRYSTTNPRWKNHWFDVCETIYELNPSKWKNKYALSSFARTICLVKEIVNFNQSNKIAWNCSTPDFPSGTELAYYIRLLDRNKLLKYSKIGTTTRKPSARMKEHLKYYYKDEVDALTVERIWDCEGIPAESFESYFRSIAIIDHPEEFKKNDRFELVDFPMDYVDKIFQEWIERVHSRKK